MSLDFATLFEHLPSAYMVLDRELRYVAMNAAYLRVTGADRESLLGRYVFEAFPNDPSDPNNAAVRELRDSFLRVLKTGEVDVVASIRYHVNRVVEGRDTLVELTWSATHSPILDAQGHVAYIVQNTTDITDLDTHASVLETRAPDSGRPRAVDAQVLRRAEQLQEANRVLGADLASLRSVFEQAPGFAAFLRGSTHVFELANGAYMQVVGHRPVLGKPLKDALPEVVDQGLLALLDRVFVTGEPFIGRGVEVMLQREPGAPLDPKILDFVYQPVRGATGQTIGIFVLGNDLTAQSLLEGEASRLREQEQVAREAADESRERARFLAEAIPQQVWTSLPSGQLDFVNRRVLDYFATSSEKILGDGWREHIHPDDVERCTERWVRALATGEHYEVEFRLRRADGVYRWHLARAEAMRDASGAVVQWFGTNTDIDDAQRSQVELRARAALEQQLIGIVSHDLRNPLNTVQLSAHLLRQTKLDQVQARTVQRLTTACERASRLVADFLDFSQARVAGQVVLRRAPTDLDGIVQRVIDDLQLAHPSRRLIIERGEGGPTTGVWDEDRLTQTLGNLLGNAVQHSRSDAPITVRLRPDGDSVSVDVINPGTLGPAELEELFHPYTRGKESGRGSKGVGLGLHISRLIVGAHGGTLEASVPGGDSVCFTVRLPRATA